MTPPPAKRIGIMGGMFDPVHEGHLQFARQAKALCNLDVLHLVPCGSPVHRGAARASADQRIRMLELAVANEAWMRIDPRECRSNEPSYTWLTVQAIQAEEPGAVLFLLAGLDAFLRFESWYRWRELLALVHLVVATRPGYVLDQAQLTPALAQELAVRRCTAGADTLALPPGRIVLASLDTPALSSTLLRELLAFGRETQGMLNPAVASYIATQGIYQQPRNEA